jgi:hypothetical protein
MGFFEIMGGSPRGDCEEGGHLCSLCALLGEFIGNSPVNGVTCG